MKLNKALNDKLMDKRLREKLLSQGKISHKEVEEYFNSLNDDEKSGLLVDSANPVTE